MYCLPLKLVLHLVLSVLCLSELVVELEELLPHVANLCVLAFWKQLSFLQLLLLTLQLCTKTLCLLQQIQLRLLRANGTSRLHTNCCYALTELFHMDQNNRIVAIA